MRGDGRGIASYVEVVKFAASVIGSLVVLLSGCAARGSEPSARRSAIVLELEVQSDYGQIYIYDAETQASGENETEDDNPLMRALDDASNSRRFVGYDNGLVDVLTPSQYNWKAPMHIVVSDDPPPLEVHGWDHVVEVPLPVPSGRLAFEASRGGAPIETPVPPNTYRARIPRRGYVAGAGGTAGDGSYRRHPCPPRERAPKPHQDA